MNSDALIDFHYISKGERFKISLLSSWRQLKYSWGIFSRNRLAILGLVLLLVYVFMAVIHPFLLRTIWQKSIYDPVVGFDIDLFINPSLPSVKHPLGTDTLGRDVLSMLMAATIPSLEMALTAALTAAVLGTLIGAISAYFRGFVDGFFSHLADLTLLMPAPLVMVIIGFTLDIGPFKFGLIYGILVGLGVVAIVLRAHALTFMNKAFIDAARIAGGGSLHIILKHLVPHMIPLAAVNMLITVTGAIFANGFIAFLGLSRAHLNWGSMIYDSFTYKGINGVIPWNVLVPSALAISLFAASFYMIALGLQDVTNPRLAERLVTGVRLPAKAKKEKAPKIPSIPVVPEPVIQGIPSIAGAGKESIPGRFSETKAAVAPLGTKPVDRLETHWITVLVLSLRSDAFAAADEYSKLFSDINQNLASRGGLVEQLYDGLWMASFGLATVIPSQASALMATTISMNAKRTIEEFNGQRIDNGLDVVKMSVGISIGTVDLRLAESTNWCAPVLAAEVGLVARTLCALAGFMRNGGVLICENTFKSLIAVQHHFLFGRKGMAKFPPEIGQKMVYELVSQQFN